jgi:hypothetical protein
MAKKQQTKRVNRIGRNQVVLTLTRSINNEKGYSREELAEHKREMRWLDRLGKSDLITVVRRKRRTLSTGTVIEQLVLEPVRTEN